MARRRSGESLIARASGPGWPFGDRLGVRPLGLNSDGGMRVFAHLDEEDEGADFRYVDKIVCDERPGHSAVFMSLSEPGRLLKL